MKNATVAAWQPNSGSFALDIDGAIANPFFPAKISKPLYACTPIIPVDGTVNMNWTDASQRYDVAISGAATVPGGALASGDYINIRSPRPPGRNPPRS